MIVVAGEALVDRIVRPDGATVDLLGGGPFNAARAIGRLRVPVAWLGGLSSDAAGLALEADLRADGVALDLVQRSDRPTTLAIATVDASGAAAYRFVVDGTAAALVESGPLAPGLPAGTRAVHVGTLGLVLEPMATTLETLVASLPPDVLLFLDPNCRPSATPDPDAYRARVMRILARADVVKASTEDLAFLRPGEAPDDAGRWIWSLGPRAVLVTDGGADVAVLAGGGTHRVEVPHVEVADTVGAGDTFGGAALAWLVHAGVTRMTLHPDVAVRAARFGCRAAAIACTRPGADPPTLAELGGWSG